jgi:hypothetical protein
MQVCYDCGETATMVLAVPRPDTQDYYCDIDGQYQQETGYPVIPIAQEA